MTRVFYAGYSDCSPDRYSVRAAVFNSDAKQLFTRLTPKCKIANDEELSQNPMGAFCLYSDGTVDKSCHGCTKQTAFWSVLAKDRE